MPDPVQGAPTAPTQTETVPKVELEQVKSQMETLRNQLLDPNYIEYLEAKRHPKAAPATPAAPVNLASMTLDQLQQMIAQGVATSMQEALKPINTRLNDVQVRQELDDVMARHEDFNDFKDKVVEILQNNQNELTIEQAYLMAKASAPAAPAAPAAPTPAPKSNERPSSSVPVDGDSIKVFKNPKEAAQAAWAEVAQRHGISGDTI